MQKLCNCLSSGGVAIYPTETLYALGCVATNTQACARIMDIKRRPMAKPLPLVIGWQEGLKLVTLDASPVLEALTEAFWPGSLSILVKAHPGLAPEVSDERGYTSVRLSPHPVAAALSRDIGAPLVATSANVSGQDPAARPQELDQELLHRVDAVFNEKPWPRGGMPSTVVRLMQNKSVEIVRAGAVSAQMLEGKGFTISTP